MERCQSNQRETNLFESMILLSPVDMLVSEMRTDFFLTVAVIYTVKSFRRSDFEFIVGRDICYHTVCVCVCLVSFFFLNLVSGSSELLILIPT